MHIKLLLSYFLLLPFLVIGQQKQLTTSVDSTKIKIGSQVNLVIKTEVAKKTVVLFPEAPSFGAFEVLESYPIDTLKKTDTYELIKRYGLTQFDSGKFVIPRLSVIINNKPHFSDSIAVEMMPVVVDTLKQKMYDIRPIIEVESTFNYNWLWLLLLLPILAGVAYYFLKIYKPKEKSEEEFFATPIEKATNLLSRLEKKELWQKGEVKTYYIELTQIIRIYIEEALEVPAMESTSSELLENLREAITQKNMALSNETLSNLDKVLKNADLVKFAKSKPLDFEITSDRKFAETIITSINSAIPEVVEDDQSSKITEAKEKTPFFTKKRIVIGVISIIVLIYASIGFVLYNNGFGFMADVFGGRSSKSILEGEWYFSEYGAPSVKIETPEILTRTVLEKSPNTPLFIYGDITSNIFVYLTAIPVDPKQKIDLNAAMEGSFTFFESKGAHSIIVNQEDYETTEGFTGKKADGSMSVPNPGGQGFRRVRYEMLLFSQEGALQQIMVIYKDQDPYADQIKQRIINSVELKKVN